MEMSELGNPDINEIGPKPRGSKVILQKSRRCLYVEIPPSGWTREMKLFGLFLVPFLGIPTIVCASFIFNFAANPSSSSALFLILPLGLFSIFWLVGLRFLANLKSKARSRHILHIGRQAYGVWKEKSTNMADIDANYEEEPDPLRAVGETRNLDLAALIPGKEVSTSDGTTTVGPYIEVREGIKTQRFGQGLQLIELEWILEEVNQHIRKLTGSEETGSMV